MTLSSKGAYRFSLVLGVLLIALSFYSQNQPKLEICGSLAQNYNPVIAFELARNVSDLQALFGAAPGACRSTLAANMDQITWIDCLIFVPIYGAFLVLFFMGMRSRDERMAQMALWAVIIAVAADYAENICLFALSGAPDRPSIWLSLLPFATGIKWLGLGLAGALGGAILSLRGGFNYALAPLCVLSFAVSVAAMYNPASFGPHVSDGIALSWLIFFLIDVREAVAR
ncbi:MAG: hypothetical protein GC166_12230 [Alphaproteobacteria bacterium]|nr:hypothetical protein [Alphaproteobacteria bacterium]